MNRDELVEQLAEKEHVNWSHWMKYLFSKCTENSDGSVTIPTEFVQRWKQQAETPYASLSEREKQSDRNRVKLIMPLIEEYQEECDAETSILEEIFHWTRYAAQLVWYTILGLLSLPLIFIAFLLGLALLLLKHALD